MECCETCRFFERQGGHGGRCRRHAQQAITFTDRNYTTGEFIITTNFDWPAVANDQWCGDYEAAQTEETTNG